MTRYRSQLGMALFLIPEAVFFFLLILAFSYFGEKPPLISHLQMLFTALLFVSAFTVWRGWRWVTVALGSAFFVGLIGAISVLNAIYGLFVLAGLIALAIVPSSALRTMALYWCFLMAVWLVIILIGSLG